MPFNLNLVVFAAGFNQPTDIAHTQMAKDGRLFITERAGKIRIVNEDGSVALAPFLDITDRVYTSHLEAGLIGLVFSPDYASSGYFYVAYTHKPSQDLRFSRFQVSSASPNLADPHSETTILNLPQSDAGHNGGDMQFGADGLLYLAVGDGGLLSEANGQDPTNLLGTILRLNLDSTAGLPPECSSSAHYSIPPDNPFVGVQEGAPQDPCNEIWVYGLRNPWRFSLDRANQDLYIGDVGLSLREEINYLPTQTAGGSNLGWACYEGNLRVNHKDQCRIPEPVYTMPIFEYAHDQSCAVTGGFVYRGVQSLTMMGHYLFADYCSGHIWSLVKTAIGWQAADHGRFLNTPAAFGEDVNGELYLASLAEGRVYHLADDTTPAPRLSIHKTAPLKVQGGEPITYTLTVSNTGSAAASQVVITDRLPSGAFHVSGGTMVGSDVTWNEPVLEPQSSVEVTMVVTSTQTLFNRTYTASADGGYLATGNETIITFIDPSELFLPVVKKE